MTFQKTIQKEKPTQTTSQNQPSFLIVNKAFFGKNNCLRVTLNHNKECYFHWGIKNIQNNGKYEWTKVKFNDLELAEIIDVFKGNKKAIAFFHNFNGTSRQIWINSSEKVNFIKVKELSKSLTIPESSVLSIILENCIWRMNLIDT